MSEELFNSIENIQKHISFVSHEIRNNISICDMYSQILKRKLELSGNLDSSLNDAIDCIQQSLQFISINLTDLKAINSLSLKNFNLSKTLENCVEMSKVFASEKDISFKLDVADEIYMYSDEAKLSSCVINIIKNAIEAIEFKGYVSLSLSAVNNIAIIKIANNGSPISENSKNSLFEYGYTTKTCGSGFGLCLTKKYLESQHAQLKLVKSDEKETIFEIDIPLGV